MTVRGTVVLVAVLAGLLAYLWLAGVGSRMHPSQPSMTADAPPLVSAPTDAVTRVELQEGPSRVVAVRGDDGRWTDGEGRAWRAGVLPDLIDTLRSLQVVMVVDPDPTTPGDFGLGAEALHLRLVDARGQRLLDLEVGHRNPAWTGVYARRGGEREVILVGSLLRWELGKLRAAAPAH